MRHITRYAYSDPVVLCQNQVRLVPQALANQRLHDFQLAISPEPVARRQWQDVFGNAVWFFSVETPHQLLEVTSDSLVSRDSMPVPDPATTPPWEWVRDRLADGTDLEPRLACQFRYESPFVQELPEARDYALVSFTPGRPILEGLLDLTRRIHAEFIYSPATTTVSTPTQQVFATRQGVCQDFAHLGISCLRSLGLAARYVSGYLLTEPPPGQTKLVGADASHAWFSVYIPEAGWIDVDPTNNVIPQEKHVTIGWGRDYGDVCPIKGVFTGGGQQSITVAVDVLPITPAAQANEPIRRLV
ncbi:MAG: transglutaminase N-terminal domain-containing protein [Planctomycetales bacterium]